MAIPATAAVQAIAGLPIGELVAWIAAGAAIFSALLSFFGARWQQRRQLRHDATQRQLERTMALRRDVYLPAVEGVTRAQGLLGRMVNLQSDDATNGQQFTDSLAAIFKVHLVATENTIRPLMRYVNALTPAYLELTAARVELTIRKAAIDGEKALIDRAAAEMDSYVQQMKQLNIAGSRDAELFARLTAGLEAERENHHTHSERHLALNREQLGHFIALAARVGQLAAEAGALIPDALLAARDEIGLTIDGTEYRRLFDEQQRAALQAMERFTAEMRQRFNPEAQG